MPKSLDEIIWAADLKSDRKLLLLALASHVNDEGVAFPGVPLLARKTGLTPRGVEKMLAAFVAIGVLSIVERGNGRGHTNKYRISTSALRSRNPEPCSGFLKPETAGLNPEQSEINPEPCSGNSLNPEQETPNAIQGIGLNPEQYSGFKPEQSTRNPEQDPLTCKEQPLKVLKKYKTGTNVPAADAAPPPQNPDALVNAAIWQRGVLLLKTGGVAEGAARTFLGKMAKDYGKAVLAQAIETVEGANPASPREYLVKVLQNLKKGVKPNDYAEERKRIAQLDLARFRTDWKAKFRAARDGRAKMGQGQPA
jgi:hypothetical protein